MESLRPLQQAGFTDVLDYGVFLFKKHFKKLFLLNLMFNIPVMLLIAIINPVYTQQYWNFIDNPNVMAQPDEIFSSMLTLYAMLFGTLGLQGLYSITLKNVMEGSAVKILYADTVLNQKKSLKQVIKECFNQFGTLLLGRFLYILIQSAVFIVLYILLIVGVFAVVFITMGITTASYTTPWITVVLSILGIVVVIAVLFCLSVIVGYFYAKYWMFLPAICIEQQKAGSSMGRCGNLGRNNFYLIGLTFTFSYILVGLFPMIINIVIGAASTISENFDLALFQVGTVLTQIFSSVLQPLLTCILTALYITLKVKREGLDMEIALWKIKREEADKRKRWLSEAPNEE